MTVHWLSQKSRLADLLMNSTEVLRWSMSHMKISVDVLLVLHLIMHHILWSMVLDSWLRESKIINWLLPKIWIVHTKSVLLLLPVLLVKLIVLIILLI